MNVSRKQAAVLSAIAVAVVGFDIWFFVSGDSNAAPVAASTGAVAIPSAQPGSTAAPEPPAAATPPQIQATAPVDPTAERFEPARPLATGPLRPGLMTLDPALVSSGPAAPSSALYPRISVILWHPEHPLALIDGVAVRPGDSVLGYRVLAIEPTQVRFESPGGAPVSIPLSAGAVSAAEPPEATEPRHDSPPH